MQAQASPSRSSSVLDSILSNKTYFFDEAVAYKPKSWCDAQDYTGKWRLGRVRKADENFVLVHFDGWSENYKQWYCKHTDIIAPLRTQSIGYTGQENAPLRDFEFDSTHIQKMERKLKLLLNDDKLQSFNPYDYTSFVRGDLFVLIDSILTYGDRIDVKDSPLVNSFFKQIVVLGLKWLKTATKNFEAMLSAVGNTTENVINAASKKFFHVQNHPASIVLSGYEILIMLRGIFGCDKRCNAFYQTNSLVMSAKELIAFFYNQDGLSKLTDILAYEDNSNNQSHRIDFKMLWPLIYSIPFTFDHSNISHLADTYQHFTEFIFLRMKREAEQDKTFIANLKADAEYQQFHARLKVYNSSYNIGMPFLLDTLFEKDMSQSTRHSNLINFNFDEFDFDKESSGVTSQPGKIRITDMLNQDEEMNELPMPLNRGRQTSTKKSLQIDITDDNTKKAQDKLKPLDSNRASKARYNDDSGSKVLSNKVDTQQFEQLQKEFLKLQSQVQALTLSQTVPKDLNHPISASDQPNIASATTKLHSSQHVTTKERQSSVDKQSNEILALLNLHGYKDKDLVQAVKAWKNFSELISDHKKSAEQANEPSNESQGLEEKAEKPANVDVSDFGKPEKGEEEPQNLLDEEFKVLTLIELLLAENKVLEASKVIKWRKKIIRIANMNGWDVARIVATNTIKKLDVSAEDILFSNLTYLQHNEHVLNLKIFESH